MIVIVIVIVIVTRAAEFGFLYAKYPMVNLARLQRDRNAGRAPALWVHLFFPLTVALGGSGEGFDFGGADRESGS